MRVIPKNRKIRELQKHITFFTNDTPSKIHLMNIDFIVNSVKFGLKITGLDKRAYENAKVVKVRELSFFFDNLPMEFDGYKILFLSDLHIDGMNPLCDILMDVIEPLSYDIAFWGGDYRFQTIGNIDETVIKLKKLVAKIQNKSEIIAILGNHDEYEIGEHLEQFGVNMLINENYEIKKADSSIFVCGVDDCHYYAAHNFDEADDGVPENAFKIILSHSPELYAEASKRNYALYLAGHTHAGQLCLPGGIPVICEANVPRKMIFGEWKYGDMLGYTSSGAGTSGTSGRFNSFSEVVLIELKKGKCN